MNLNITKLANWETDTAKDFLGRINSKLIMDVRTNQFVNNDEWLDMIEFTIPHLEKAFTKKIRQIITEEEVVKIELIKKVTVESVQHLTKNVNFIDQYDEQTGEVIPNKILNSYKEETLVTYENRFLFTLMKLIESFIYLREKDLQSEYKGKNYQKAEYQGEAKLKNEKVNVNFDYSSEKYLGGKDTKSTEHRVDELKKDIKMLKKTELYQFLEARKITLIKPPLKMTNVLLKNVNFQYAVRLWNYLNEQMDMKNKSERLNKSFEEKGQVKSLVDEDIFLMHLIFKNREVEERRKAKKGNQVEQKKITKELTDALLERIIDLNPELSDIELKQMIAEKYVTMKTRKVISLKPVEDKFKEKINKYMNQVKEVRLK